MNREKIKRLSKQLGVGRKVKCCLWFDGNMGQEDDGTISCGHVGHAIPRTECPPCKGLECLHTAKFIHIVIEDVEAGPDGEIVTVAGDDDDSETQALIEKEY